MEIANKISKKALDYRGISPVKMAFLGDSVTHGCFELIERKKDFFDCRYDFQAVYHSRLKQKIETVFPSCFINVLNAGISGDSAVGGLERLERDIISNSPDMVVVCFGLNDVHGREGGLETYINALSSIFDKLKESNIATVFMTPNMMCTDVLPHLEGWLKDAAVTCAELQNNGIMDLYMDSAKALCEEKGIIICDCYSAWKKIWQNGAEISWLLSNNVNHPTREMHSLFADMLFETIFLR